MLAAATVAGELDNRQPCRFGAARGEHFAFVPLETPDGRFDAVEAGVNRDVPGEVGAQRFVFVAKKPDRAVDVERLHPFVGAFVEVSLFPGGGEIWVGLFVLQQHTVAVEHDMSDEPTGAPKSQARLP